MCLLAFCGVNQLLTGMTRSSPDTTRYEASFSLGLRLFFWLAWIWIGHVSVLLLTKKWPFSGCSWSGLLDEVDLCLVFFFCPFFLIFENRKNKNMFNLTAFKKHIWFGIIFFYFPVSVCFLNFFFFNRHRRHPLFLTRQVFWKQPTQTCSYCFC